MTLPRPESATDIAAIHTLHAACFPSDAEARLVDALRAAGRLSVSLVVEIDGAVVGHVAMSPVTAGPIAAVHVGSGLAPLAVADKHRRKGLGATLVKSSVAACRDAGFGWAVVLGEPEYYGRFGFRPAAGFGLGDEYGGGDAFQAIELVPGGLPIGAGIVRYAVEFSVFGE